MPTQGPHFNFYQAPPGPDSSRQYSDWQNAILAQGEAFNEPLRLLLKGMIEGKLQDKRIRADKEARADERDYQKTRDSAADARFQQDFALRQGAEDRQVQREQYGRAQNTADLRVLLSQMLPGNSVEKLDPQTQALQQMLGAQPEVPLSPLREPVAPHPQVIQEALRDHAIMQRDQEKQQVATDANNARLGYIRSHLDNLVLAKIMSPARRAQAEAHLAQGGAEAEHAALTLGEKSQEEADMLGARADTLKNLEDFAKENPNDPNVVKYGKGLELLRPGTKNAAVDKAYWDGQAKEITKQFYGLSDGAEKTPKKPTIEFPGAGTVTLNTSLGTPQEYRVDANGQPILPGDADAELTALAEKAVPAHTEMGIAIAPEERAAAVQQKKLQYLQIAGWREAGSSDPVQAMNPFSAMTTPVALTPTDATPQAAPTAPTVPQPAPQDPLANLPPDVLQAAHAARAQGPDAVRKVLQNAMAFDQAKSAAPENSGAVGSEFLKKDPEPQWWWSYNSQYAPMLKQYGGSVEKARAAWAERWKKEFGR